MEESKINEQATEEYIRYDSIYIKFQNDAMLTRLMVIDPWRSAVLGHSLLSHPHLHAPF